MVSLLLPIIYLAFISLGLPDGILGAAWPSMYTELGVDISAMGLISMVIAGGTILSSLFSDRIIKRFGTGMVTFVSVLMTAVALLGFGLSRSYWLLLLCSVPYGLGAGSVDAALNHYVAVHYAARHMSFLHCFWGVGATMGPYIMGFCLTGGSHWSKGYEVVALMQFVLVAALMLSLPLWKKRQEKDETDEKNAVILSKRELLRIPGAKAIFLVFFCYCALEQTCGIWASSFLALAKNVDAETAAKMGSLFYLGIAGGRLLCGFVTERIGDRDMVRIGLGIMTLGIGLVTLPFGAELSCFGLVLTGFGCAPVYPSLIHAAPRYFDETVAQSMISMQMAMAYTGSTFMPPLFGVIAEKGGFSAFPLYIGCFFVAMACASEMLNRSVKKKFANSKKGA